MGTYTRKPPTVVLRASELLQPVSVPNQNSKQTNSLEANRSHEAAFRIRFLHYLKNSEAQGGEEPRSCPVSSIPSLPYTQVTPALLDTIRRTSPSVCHPEAHNALSTCTWVSKPPPEQQTARASPPLIRTTKN